MSRQWRHQGGRPPPQLPEEMVAQIEKHKKQLQALAAGAKSNVLIEKERKRLQQLIKKAETEQSLQALKAEETQKNTALEAAIRKAMEYGVLAREAATEVKAATAKAKRVVIDINAAKGAVDGLKSAVHEAESTMKGILSKCKGVEKTSDVRRVGEESVKLSGSVRSYTQKVSKLFNEVCKQIKKDGAVTEDTKSRGEKILKLKENAEMLFKQAKEKAQWAVDANTALKAAKQGASRAMDTSGSLMGQAGQAGTKITEAQKTVESGR